jgi:hypothetical protein
MAEEKILHLGRGTENPVLIYIKCVNNVLTRSLLGTVAELVEAILAEDKGGISAKIGRVPVCSFRTVPSLVC